MAMKMTRPKDLGTMSPPPLKKVAVTGGLYRTEGGGDDKKAARAAKKAVRKQSRAIRKEGRAEANAETGIEVGPGGNIATRAEIASTAGWAAKQNARYQAERAGGSRKEIRKAGRAAKREATQGTKKGIKQAGENAWDANKAAKKAFKKDPSARNATLLKEAAKNKRASNAQAEARVSRKFQ